MADARALEVLLHPWNPALEPATIIRHMARLEETLDTPQGARVWWPWISDDRPAAPLSAEASKQKWAHVASFVERVGSTGSPIVLLVTDFTMLHALLVEEVSYGSSIPEDGKGPTADYVSGKQVGLWFKVIGIRSISHERIATLDQFSRLLFDDGERGLVPYDPYRNYAYPYPVDVSWVGGKDTLELTDDARHSFSTEDRDGSVCLPPNIEEAIVGLKDRFGVRGFRLIQGDSVLFLANAHLQQALLAKRDNWDHSGIFINLAKAFERQWAAVGVQLERSKVLGGGDFSNSWDEARGESPKVFRGTWLGIGGLAFTVDYLRRRGDNLSHAASALTNARLSDGTYWSSWIEKKLAKRRGKGAHEEVISSSEARALWSDFMEQGYYDLPSALAPLLHAMELHRAP